MQGPHAVLRLLQERRGDADRLGEGNPVKDATCELLDELLRRTKVLADQYPEQAPMNLRTGLEMPAVIRALGSILSTMERMYEVVSESGEAASAHCDPLVRFVERLRSEGFDVNEHDNTVTDTKDWAVLEPAEDPDVLVQREAERITRAERTVAYQERVTRMAVAYEEALNDYAQRIRALI
ncbi:hypothetical protein [Mycobacteroides abscessus]|uniref:hypothetical protein n=1 Tax=Mycobacteroides abscessus TaxID=36809 RepID=UPI000C2623C4|nr:hypothetical protein [Mycobacteroides abscessus]